MDIPEAHLGQDVRADFLDQFVPGESPARLPGGPRLQRQHGGEQVQRLVLVARDVRVLVQPEDLRRVGLGFRVFEKGGNIGLIRILVSG